MQKNFTAAQTTRRSIVRRSAAGLAGVAIAGAGLTALSAPATAAPVSTWDALAQCESTGNWSINTGNGYYGGLQFSPSSWRAAGGSGMPHQASKAEQIRVAENLLSMQGWGAWPACSAKLGLYGTSSSANVTTQSVDSDRAAERAASAERQAERAAAAERTERADRAAAAEQAERAAAAEQAERAERAASAERQAERAERASASQAQSQQAPAQQAAPKPQASERAAAVTPVQRSGETVTVKPGDTLSKLANAHGVQGGYKALHAANASTVNNPNLIFVGQTLYLPAA